MGEQHFWRSRRVARLVKQFTHKHRHGLWVETRALQNLNANPVGLFFVLAGEADHTLLGAGQRPGQGRHSGLRAGHRQQNRTQGTDPGQRRIALLIFHRAGEMPLRHVGDFVRHDRGQFALVIRVAEQGGVEDHIAAEEGEGVDLVVINQIEVERGTHRVGVSHQTHTQPVDILHQQRVVDQRRATAQLADVVIPHLHFLTY